MQQNLTLPPIAKKTISIDLGNKQTILYLNNKIYKFQSQIIFNKDFITVGQQKKSFKSNLNKKVSNMEMVVVKDFLDLFVRTIGCGENKENNNHNMSQNGTQNMDNNYIQNSVQNYIQNNKKKGYDVDNKMLKFFSYYPYKVSQDKDSKVRIQLGKCLGPIVRNLDKNHQEENIVQYIKDEYVTLDQCVSIFLKAIFDNYVHIYEDQNNKNQQCQLEIVFNYYGYQGNPYIVSLCNLCTNVLSNFNISQKSIFFQPSTTSLATYYYMHLPKLQKSTILSVIDFGDHGFSFSIFKLHPSNQKILQILQNFSCSFSGTHITHIIIDIISDHIKLHKGVNIKSTPEMIQELYFIVQQAKISLEKSNEVWVRLKGYPLQEEVGFYLSREKMEKVMKERVKEILKNVEEISGKYEKNEKFLLSGGSIKLPLFYNQLIKIINNKQIIHASGQWKSIGNYLTRSSQLIILQKNFTHIFLHGDDDYSSQLILPNQQVPLRFIKQLQFPRGQLQFTLKFYQNNLNIGKYVIKSQNLQFQQKMNFIIQIEEGKKMKVYSTKYLGDVEMKGDGYCQKIVIDKRKKVVMICKEVKKVDEK